MNAVTPCAHCHTAPAVAEVYIGSWRVDGEWVRKTRPLCGDCASKDLERRRTNR